MAQPQHGRRAPEAESFSAFESSTAKQDLHSSPRFASCSLTSVCQYMEKTRSPEFFGSVCAISSKRSLYATTILQQLRNAVEPKMALD